MLSESDSFDLKFDKSNSDHLSLFSPCSFLPLLALLQSSAIIIFHHYPSHPLQSIFPFAILFFLRHPSFLHYRSHQSPLFSPLGIPLFLRYPYLPSPSLSPFVISLRHSSLHIYWLMKIRVPETAQFHQKIILSSPDRQSISRAVFMSCWWSLKPTPGHLDLSCIRRDIARWELPRELVLFFPQYQSRNNECNK